MRTSLADLESRRMAAVLRYGLAAGCAVGVLLATRALEGPFGGVLFSMPLAATALIALALGAGPGLLASTTMGLAIWFFFQPPRGSFLLESTREVARLAFYFVAAFAVLGAIGLLDRTRRRRRAQAEELRTLADHSPEVIARFDRALRHTFINAYGAKVYGIPAAQVLGKSNAELGMPADKVAFWKERFEEVLRTGNQKTVDFEFDSPTLGHMHFSSLFVPERDESGPVRSILAITRDVTAQKEAETKLERVDEGIRDREERLRLVVDATGVGAFDLDPATGRLEWSAHAKRHFGLPEDAEVSLETFSRGLHPDDRPRVEALVQRALRGEDGGRYSTEYRTVGLEDGVERWLSARGRVTFDAGGRAVRFVGLTLDITERKRAEEAVRESEERLRSVLENMSEGLVLFDGTGTITYQNPAAVRIHDGRLTGERRTLDHLTVNWKVRSYPEGSLVPPEQWAIPRVLRGERVRQERFFVDCVEDPERSFVGIYSGCPVYDAAGKLAYGFLTIEEITEQAHAEAAVRRANEALREADRRKNAFLAVLSHELRNPLTPIRNSVFIMERSAPGGEQSRRALTVIDRQVTQLARLVDDLLDVTRISRGKIRLQRESLELNDIVRGTAEDLRGLFRANGLQFHASVADQPLRAFGDRTRIAQVVGNLLQNAAKFTPRGGSVTLSLHPEGQEAVIEVRDTGVGIEPGLRSKLFEPFVQADATLDRSSGGLGLGLALVKGLVELHGGTVTARSAGPGAGAEFVIRLPLERREPQEAPPPRGRRDGRVRSSMRVLLIEDNADAAETLKEALELNGHEVETAGNGIDGLEKARAFHPDVVLCDIGLPGIDGFEVARRMRGDPLLRSACLVALSGYAAPEDVERSRAAGFVRHLAKPPDLGVLESALSESCVARGQGHDP